MQIFSKIINITERYQNVVFTLGNFDGVHLAHQRILQRVVDLAKKFDGCSVVLTFSNHPLSVLQPDKCPLQIQDADEKIEYLRRIGVDVVFCIPFDEKFAELLPEEFIDLLRINIDPLCVVAGYDFAFGKGGKGTAKMLTAAGFNVEEQLVLKKDEEIVSSTFIRAMLTEGRVDEAEKLLGRPLVKKGKVVHGLKKGRKLGFPTLNIHEENETTIIKEGVYLVAVDFKGKSYDGICNFGYSPTFKVGEKRIEVYLFEFEGDAYGENVTVYFKKRLRDELRFGSIGELVEQINKDVIAAKKMLQENF